MMNEEMIKFAQIRSSYARKRFGTLSNEEKALADYETFILELIKENDYLQQENDNLKLENNMLKVSLLNNKRYSYGIRGSTRSDVDDE